MFRFLKKKKKESTRTSYPTIQASIEDIRRAYSKWYEQKADGISSSILINDDNAINYKYLAPYLNGIPDKPFYQSKETLDIFEAKDRLIAIETDIVQRALDRYLKTEKKLPLIEHSKRINYFELQQKKYLREKPETVFYVTNTENMISHFEPN